MVDRLAEDHARARDLAQFLGGIPGVALDWETPGSNMIFFTLTGASPCKLAELIQMFAEQKIRISSTAEGRIRLVMHYWVDDAAIKRLKSTFNKVFGVE
jgi:threonine aldolase